MDLFIGDKFKQREHKVIQKLVENKIQKWQVGQRIKHGIPDLISPTFPQMGGIERKISKGNSVMPQLDKVSFFSQYFWLIACLVVLFFLTVKFFIPKVSRVIKLRKYLINFSGFPFLVKESEQVRSSFNGMFAKGCSCSRILFNDNIQQTFAWLQTIRHNTNKSQYQTVNDAYFLLSARHSLTDNLSIAQTLYNEAAMEFTRVIVPKLAN